MTVCGYPADRIFRQSIQFKKKVSGNFFIDKITRHTHDDNEQDQCNDIPETTKRLEYQKKNNKED